MTTRKHAATLKGIADDLTMMNQKLQDLAQVKPVRMRTHVGPIPYSQMEIYDAGELLHGLLRCVQGLQEVLAQTLQQHD